MSFEKLVQKKSKIKQFAINFSDGVPFSLNCFGRTRIAHPCGLCLKCLGWLMHCRNQWGEGDIEGQVNTENDYPWPLPLIGNIIYYACIKFPCDTFCNKTVV